ncbi:MAG: hypothetical protein Q4D16_23750 [Eubacteriales bacterium]|nr:hypothetical protein [Eubacteriales bacterium]
MDKVRSVIKQNRKRKLRKHKKLSVNRIIEIDNYWFTTQTVAVNMAMT